MLRCHAKSFTSSIGMLFTHLSYRVPSPAYIVYGTLQCGSYTYTKHVTMRVCLVDDDDYRRFVKRIAQNASTALRVPVRCEEISL